MVDARQDHSLAGLKQEVLEMKQNITSMRSPAPPSYRCARADVTRGVSRALQNVGRNMMHQFGYGPAFQVFMLVLLWS